MAVTLSITYCYSTPLDGMLFGIMGLFIVLNTVMAAWLLALWCNARTGYPRAIVSGVRLGLCMLLAISGDVFENSDYDRGRAKIEC
jgi:hypothetical protein